MKKIVKQFENSLYFIILYFMFRFLKFYSQNNYNSICKTCVLFCNIIFLNLVILTDISRLWYQKEIVFSSISLLIYIILKPGKKKKEKVLKPRKKKITIILCNIYNKIIKKYALFCIIMLLYLNKYAISWVDNSSPILLPVYIILKLGKSKKNVKFKKNGKN